MVPLVVRHPRREPVRVLFLLATGAPTTFLRPETLQALGYTDNAPADANVLIQGIPTTVGVSHGHFASVDLLGADFLSTMDADLRVAYATLECTLSRAGEAAVGAEVE